MTAWEREEWMASTTARTQPSIAILVDAVGLGELLPCWDETTGVFLSCSPPVEKKLLWAESLRTRLHTTAYSTDDSRAPPQ
jgi:hypothetical protein